MKFTDFESNIRLFASVNQYSFLFFPHSARTFRSCICICENQRVPCIVVQDLHEACHHQLRRKQRSGCNSIHASCAGCLCEKRHVRALSRRVGEGFKVVLVFVFPCCAFRLFSLHYFTSCHTILQSNTHTYTHTYSQIHTYSHTHSHTHTHTYTHTHAHARTHTSVRMSKYPRQSTESLSTPHNPVLTIRSLPAHFSITCLKR